MARIDKDLNDYVKGIKRHKWFALVTATSLIAIAVAVAFLWPPSYRSTATILIEQQEIPFELVRSTVTSFADQRIQIISQRAMTRQNLTKVIEKYDLYADDRKTDAMEEVIEKMRADIHIDTVSSQVVDPRSGRPTLATLAFTVAYDNESPVMAQKVANDLVSLYLGENLKTRSDLAAQASSFFADESDKLAQQISQTESAISAFKAKHMGTLPDSAAMNMQTLERTERDLLDVNRELADLNERRLALVAQLSLIDPTQGSSNGALDPKVRLEAVKTELIRMESLYSNNHPDLVRMRKEYEALRQQFGDTSNAFAVDDAIDAVRQELVIASKQYTEAHPEVKKLQRKLDELTAQKELDVGNSNVSRENLRVVNPNYVQVETQLKLLNIDEKALQERARDLRLKLADYESRMEQQPEVEREYRALLRDHESAWEKYQEMKSKQSETQLAQTLEEERKGERFTLIEPPALPEKPVEPNRIALLTTGFVLALILGVGLTLLRVIMDTTLLGSGQVVRMLNMPPLGVIPYLVTKKEKRLRRLRRSLATGSVFAVALLSVTLIHMYYRPLDVLWFLAMRRLDIL